MAEFHTSRGGSARQTEMPAPAHPLSRMTYALGSLISIGLVIGLGVWGYKLMVRDVSGVPVIRAAEGPMRIQPDDPGGRQTLNQGLSVNDVAAVGTAGAAPDQLILAPAPLDLSDEDAPGIAAAEQADPDQPGEASQPDQTAEAEPAAPAPTEDVATDAEVEVEVEVEVEPDMLALAESISQGIQPLEALPGSASEGTAPASEGTAPASDADADADAEADGDTGAEDEPQIVADIEGAIALSLRPRARPSDLSNIQQVVAVTDEAQGTRDVDPGSIVAGTRLAQLGAFSSEAIAREEWDRLGARFEDYLAGKDRVIQRATSGGRTFYRLRAMGFADLADARRFCSALVAEKAECIPVVTK